MKRNSFNVLFFIKKAKLLKNGEASVCMRITVNCARVETNIRKSIDPPSWNQAKECVRGKSRKARDLNAYIENAKIKPLQQRVRLPRTYQLAGLAELGDGLLHPYSVTLRDDIRRRWRRLAVRPQMGTRPGGGRDRVCPPLCA